MRRLQAFVRAWLWDGLGLKIVALLLSLLVFRVIHGSEEAHRLGSEEAYRSVSIDVVASLPSLHSPHVLVSDVPDHVKATLRGPRSLLETLQRDAVPPVPMDLRDARKRTFEFDDSLFDLPSGVRVQRVVPASVALRWEPRRTKRVAVVVEVVGDLAPGRVSRQAPRAEPVHVVVTGPRRELRLVREARTEEIDVADLAPGRHERRVPLVAPPLHVTIEGTGQATVILEVVERPLAPAPLPPSPRGKATP